MAKYVVEPRSWKRIVMCGDCGCLYYPETRTRDMFATTYEACPKCGCKSNTEGNCIPLWSYNLRKYIRSWFNKHCELKGREIPEKVLDRKVAYADDIKFRKGRCPACDNTVVDRLHTHYCGACGQAIAWDDAEE